MRWITWLYLLLLHLCWPYFEGSSCQPPISPYGSTIIYPALQGNYKNGSAVVFSCKHGFYLTRPPVIKCSGSIWTPVNFECFLSKSCFFFSYRTMLIIEVWVSIDADSSSLSKRTALERSTIMALEYRNNSLLRHSWYIHVRATRRETCLAHARNPILSSFIVSALSLTIEEFDYSFISFLFVHTRAGNSCGQIYRCCDTIDFFPCLVCNKALDIHRHAIGFEELAHSRMGILPIEVYLREENVVTGAGVRLEDFGHMVLQIQVNARISNKWVQISHFKVTNCLQTLILTILSTLSSLFSLLYGSHWLLE